MTNNSDIIVWLVSLNNGRIVGKTRLQKIVYLLENFGLNSGFDFYYYNYGPFSPEVARATDEAVAQDRLDAKEKSGFHAVPYTQFTSDERPPKKICGLPSEKIGDLLEIMEQYTAIELEVAATISYLYQEAPANSDVFSMVKRLKPIKATKDRLEKAQALLKKMEAETSRTNGRLRSAAAST